MNYQRIYDELIARAVTRHGHPATFHRKKKGHANHHIKPAAFFEGGRKNPATNAPANLCFLTHREHFLAHWLLARLHGGRMAHAFAYMCSNGRYTGTFISSRVYERYLIAGMKSRNADPEWQQRNAEACRKRGSDPEWLAQITEENRLKADNPEWQKRHAAGVRKRNDDPDWRARHEENLKALHQSADWKKAMSDIGYARARVIVGVPFDEQAPLTFVKGSKMMREKGFNPPNICLCLSGKSKYHKGHTWREATPEEVEQYKSETA